MCTRLPSTSLMIPADMDLDRTWEIPRPEDVGYRLKHLHELVESTDNGFITFGLFQRVADREAAVRWMKEELDAPVREIRLSKTERNPLQLLRKLPDEPRCCVQIYDLEDALPEVTGYINYGREAYLEVPHALVFWVGPHGLQQVARNAPDFWAWRSGVFDVRTESPRVAESVTQHAMVSNVRYTDRGDLERKASLYEGLIKEQLERDEPREDYIARLRERLIGVLYYLRQFDKMEREAQLLLEWAQDHDAEQEASAYHLLGIVAQERRKFDAAERLYQQSLDIERRLDNEHGAATTLHQLGIVAQERRDFDAAERFYRESLDIDERLDDEHGTATTLHQLGIVAQERRDVEAAEQFYRQSLDIERRLDDEHGAAMTLHQLGQIAQERRDFDAAERFYQQSLDIKRRLDDEHGAGLTLARTGLLHAEREQYDAAIESLARAREIFTTLNDEQSAGTVDQELVRILAEAPDERRGALRQQWLDAGLPPVWDGV